jgi:hypothetical protein
MMPNPPGHFRLRVPSYTWTWTIPIGMSIAPTDHYVVQAEGYGPLVDAFAPC